MGFERIRMLRHLLGGAPGHPLTGLDTSRSLQAEAELRAILGELRSGERFETGLDETQYAVIDTETTGFSPQEDALLSIAAVRVDGLRVPSGEGYHTYVCPGKDREIPEVVQRLTGITPERVEDAPSPALALQEFLQYVEDRVLVAHHAGHDVRFLNAALRRAFGVELDRQVLDTGKIAMVLHPFRKYPSLDTLLSLYDIPVSSRHHALGDARMTARVLCHQLRLLKESGIFRVGQLWERLLLFERGLGV